MADQKTYAATRLLKGIGVTPTAENLRLATGWMRAEGGLANSTNNPLNTTLKAAGAQGSMNRDGVQNYGTLDQGIDADVATLKNSRYDAIRRALAGGDQNQFISAVGSSPWGTGGDLLSRVLGSTPAAAGAGTRQLGQKAPAATPEASSTQPATPTTSVAPVTQDPADALIQGQMTALMSKQPAGQSTSAAMVQGGTQSALSAAAANDAAERAAKAQQAQAPVDPSKPTAEAAQSGPTNAGPPVKGATGAAAWTQQHLGVKYVYGGNDPNAGIDCSAFTQHAWASQGVTLPRTTYDQIHVGQPVANLTNAKPGDLLFPSKDHVMLYLGNGQAAEAPHTGDVTKNIDVSGMDFISIRRPGT